MSEKILSITKNSVVGLSLPLLIAIFVGIWRLSDVISDWERKLYMIEMRIADRWSYRMEKDAMNELQRLNPDIEIPDVSIIRADHLIKVPTQ